MNFSFSEESLQWLKSKGFNDWEIEDVQRCVSLVAKNALKNEETFKLPEGTTMKVAALTYAILTNLDEELLEKRIITISEEVKDAYNEEIEIGELEEIHSKLKKIKLGRIYSDARKKSSIKKGSASLD